MVLHGASHVNLITLSTSNAAGKLTLVCEKSELFYEAICKQQLQLSFLAAIASVYCIRHAARLMQQYWAAAVAEQYWQLQQSS